LLLQKPHRPVGPGYTAPLKAKNDSSVALPMSRPQVAAAGSATATAGSSSSSSRPKQVAGVSYELPASAKRLYKAAGRSDGGPCCGLCQVLCVSSVMCYVT
jgi:hypothetical protein